MGIFSRGSRGSDEQGPADPFTSLADALTGIRPWMKPEVKPAQDGRSVLTFRTRPAGGWIVTNDSHGWTGLKAEIDKDGHYLPAVDASPVFLRPDGTPAEELTSILMALCGEDLGAYVKAHGRVTETDLDAARLAEWAAAELQALRNEGRVF